MGYRIRIVKRPELLTPSHFIRYVLRTEWQVEVARSLLTTIAREDGWDCRDWKRFCEIHNVKQGMYSKVIKQLRRAGLVEKRNQFYYLSRDFITALRRLADYWEEVYQATKRGEKLEF